MKMVFMLLFLIIFQTLFPAKIAKIPLNDILKDVSLLCLGSLGDLTLSYDAGLAAGYLLKQQGYDAYVVGTLDTLSKDDKDPLNRVNVSAFITAHVYSLFARGLATAGIIPIFDGTILDKEVVVSLNTRDATYPIVVDSEVKKNLLSELGYNGSVFLSNEIGKYIDGIKLSWKITNVDVESIRKKLLKNSIVKLSNEKQIYINQPFVESGLLVFSNDPEILRFAKDILDGYENALGRRPW